MYTADGQVRPPYAVYSDWLIREPEDALRQKRAEADSLFHRVGITFAVYGEQDGNERLIPFDIVPRILSADEWRKLAAGLRQRVQALNAFIADIYHGQDILRAGLHRARADLLQPPVPAGDAGRSTCPAASTPTSPASTSCAPGQGEFYVLEDNLRVPSGVSYMLEDRKMMMRLFPELFALQPRWRRSSTTRTGCSRTCASVAPDRRRRPGRGRADARRAQQRLLRARLPRAADGRRAGRRPGPVRARRLRLHAHHAGPAARRRDLPPHRRRLPRSAGVPAGLRARRAGPDVGLPRGPRHRRQRHRHRHRRRQVDLPLRAGHDPLLPAARSRCSPTCRRGCCAGRTTSPTRSRTSTSWSSRKSTARAATAC